MEERFWVKLNLVYEKHIFTDEECRRIEEVINRMVSIYEFARKEGYLMIGELTDEDDEIYRENKVGDLPSIDENSFEEYLRPLLRNVVDGSDQKDIIKIGETTLRTENFTPIEYVIYVMYLMGTLNLQCGMNIINYKMYMYNFMPMKNIGEKYELLVQRITEFCKVNKSCYFFCEENCKARYNSFKEGYPRFRICVSPDIHSELMEYLKSIYGQKNIINAPSENGSRGIHPGRYIIKNTEMSAYDLWIDIFCSEKAGIMSKQLQ